MEPSDLGRAGGSARREYERRRARDEQRTREWWGPLGGIAVRLTPERASTASWYRGALGEERLGAMLDGLASDRLAVLHDRGVPRSRANIDHIVVAPGGVWVVDAKRYKNRRPHLRTEGGLIRPRVEKLYVGSRSCTRLVDGVLGQGAAGVGAADRDEHLLPRTAVGVPRLTAWGRAASTRTGDRTRRRPHRCASRRTPARARLRSRGG